MEKLYELTDGYEIFKQEYMTRKEFAEAQKQAERATDGNLYWRVSPGLRRSSGQLIFMTPECIEKGVCYDPKCSDAVKQHPHGMWFITMGHAGFNSPKNNRDGYATKEKAYAAMNRYLNKGKK